MEARNRTLTLDEDKRAIDRFAREDMADEAEDGEELAAAEDIRVCELGGKETQNLRQGCQSATANGGPSRRTESTVVGGRVANLPLSQALASRVPTWRAS